MPQALIPPRLCWIPSQGRQMVSLVALQSETSPSPTEHDLQGMQADLAVLEISLAPHS